MDVLIEPLPDTTFFQMMAGGHKTRKGHELDALYVSTDGGKLWKVVRTCCGEEVPSE